MDGYPIMIAVAPPALDAEVSSAVGQPQAIRSFVDYRAASSSLASARPGVAVVGLREPAEGEPIELVRELASCGATVVVHAPRKDPEVILSVMRAGAREFFVTGEEAAAARSVQALLESSGRLRLASVTAVLSAKGGMGATTIATHLAGALARRDERVCLLDLDFEMGDVLTNLDLTGSYTLADVAANSRRLDRELLDASVPRHASGVWVLSQADKAAESERVGGEEVSRILRFLRHHYDEIVLDGLRSFGDAPLAALDLADRVLLVVTQEITAVRNAQRMAEILRQLWQDARRIEVVVNRYQRRSKISLQVIEETLNLPVRATVGNDYSGLAGAVERGVLVWEESPRSPVALDAEALAESISAAPIPVRPTSSFLSRLFTTKVVFNGAR